MSVTQDTAVVDAGEDASNIRKTFHVRKDLVGQIVSFDGDKYVLDFKKTSVASDVGVR
jgi:hypothetical protein